jgi:hypothetical protein
MYEIVWEQTYACKLIEFIVHAVVYNWSQLFQLYMFLTLAGAGQVIIDQFLS